MNNVICIVGPTASGKTGLSIELAKRINGEIISADSMQVYQGLDIGTAKIKKEEMQNISHHLIDICKPSDKFSVADFKRMCYDKIDEIIARAKVPIIVGGTGLYISAVVLDMNFTDEEADTEYREELYRLAEQKSNMYVYKMLEEIDAETAKTIHPNNLKRVIRALEIAKLSGNLKSIHMKEEQKRIKMSIGDNSSKYKFHVFYLDFERSKLYERIEHRIDIMLSEGLLDEAKKVYDMNLPNDVTCMQAIGYKEFFPYFKGEISLDEAVLNLKKETRRYAKRQETWFKNKLEINSIDGNKDKKEQINDIINFIN